jgi:hypothetical protein
VTNGLYFILPNTFDPLTDWNEVGVAILLQAIVEAGMEVEVGVISTTNPSPDTDGADFIPGSIRHPIDTVSLNLKARDELSLLLDEGKNSIEVVGADDEPEWTRDVGPVDDDRLPSEHP